jgi:hypothetical protein
MRTLTKEKIMRSREMVRRVVVLLAVLAVAGVSQAQTVNPAVNISAVVRGGVVIVSYDLVSSSAAEFSVVLEASTDGGKNYSVRPRAVKGDVGPMVRAGTGKQITWQAAQDVESLDVDRYRYRVVAKPVTGKGSSSRTLELDSPPSAAAPGYGGGRRWGAIALVGGGGTLAMLGTTALKKEHYYTNKPLVWAGVAAAAGGAALLSIGRRQDSAGTQVMIRPGGVMVQHSMPLRGGLSLGRQSFH